MAIAAACTGARSDAQIAFTDVTAGSGLDAFSHNPNPLAVPGLLEWTMGGFGIADFNGDGRPDIFVPRGGVSTDRLFVNNGDGTFANEAATRGVAAVHAGNGVACADFDGDGDVDIFVTSFGSGTDNLGQVGRHRLYRNDGGAFAEVAVPFGVATTSTAVATAAGAAWGDLDLDGDLDLAACGYSGSANGNRVFRNDGGRFTDITGSGIAMPATWGFQPLFADMTGDGFPELLVAADFGTSRAFRNRRDGSFELATAAFGMGLDRNGMGICAADLDRNGAPDAYVSSIFSDAPPAGGLNGNALYLNDGSGLCTEAAAERGCSDGGWGWGVAAADLDLDGWEDLVEVNGRNSAEWASEPEYLYRNSGRGHFVRLGIETGFSFAGDARCVGFLDYDLDGDLDILVLANSGPLRLFRNDSVRLGRWLELELVGGGESRVAPHGSGSVVECEVAGTTVRRWVQLGGGFQSSGEPLVHFGIPGAAPVATVRILWPSGQATVRHGVALDARIVIAAPDAADVDGDGSVGAGDIAGVLAQWGQTDRSVRAMRAADVVIDGAVDARDLTAVLSAWGR